MNEPSSKGTSPLAAVLREELQRIQEETPETADLSATQKAERNVDLQERVSILKEGVRAAERR